jgi:RNA polymerase sigma factor (TIGR02999 family)
MPLLYDQLHRLASSCLRAERPDDTLRATALVHEAYLQLVDSEVAWEGRSHFYAVAARVLRHILDDYAKASRRQKRGGGANKLPRDEAAVVGPEISHDIVELDDALKLLAAQDPRKSEIVQLIVFGGLTYDETAKALDV